MGAFDLSIPDWMVPLSWTVVLRVMRVISSVAVQIGVVSFAASSPHTGRERKLEHSNHHSTWGEEYKQDIGSIDQFAVELVDMMGRVRIE